MDALHDLMAEKAQSRAAFEDLRDALLGRFEALEGALTAPPLAARPPGCFMLQPWQRQAEGAESGAEAGAEGGGGGGGVMATMAGRVFEKVGVQVSTVFGELSQEFRKQIPGAENSGRFFAT